MNINTQEKRMGVAGVGRPWMRSKFPSSNDQEWRIASGNAYGGNILGIVPGNLTGLVQAEVDIRLTGVNLNLFDTAYIVDGQSTWDPDCWVADLDWSGVSTGNDDNNNRSGTLISPRHLLFIRRDHSGWAPDIGKIMRFAKADGSFYNSEIIGRKEVSEGDTSDFTVCYLDADVPSGITYYKILPANFEDYLGEEFGLPITFSSYHTHATSPAVGPNYVQLGESFSQLWSYPAVQERGTATTHAGGEYWHGVASGDSGNPSFIIIDGELVLIGLHLVGNHFFYQDVAISGNAIDGNILRTQVSVVNDLMLLAEAEGGGSDGYQLTFFDLAGVQIPPTNFFNLITSQSIIHGTMSGQSLRHGAVSTQTLVHGIISSQAEPS